MRKKEKAELLPMHKSCAGQRECRMPAPRVTRWGARAVP
jgi:hypothetical protein